MTSDIYPRLAGEPGHLKASWGPRELLAAGRQPPLGSNNAGWPARKRAIEAVVGLARRLQLARSRDYRVSAFAPLPCEPLPLVHRLHRLALHRCTCTGSTLDQANVRQTDRGTGTRSFAPRGESDPRSITRERRSKETFAAPWRKDWR